MSQLKGLSATTYAGLLRCSINARELSSGKLLHDQIIRSADESDLLLQNLLVLLYRSCGAIDEARAVFSRTNHRNTYSWNIMIGAERNSCKESLALFQRMWVEDVAPDHVTFSTILGSCAHECAVSEGLYVHHAVVNSGFDSDVVVGTSVLDMYGKCGSLDNALVTFIQLPDRNIISWNAMLSAYASHDYYKEVKQLFHQMHSENVIPDRVTYITAIAASASKKDLLFGKRLYACIANSKLAMDGILQNTLLNLYGKCGERKETTRIFSQLQSKSHMAWNAMMVACAQFEHVEDALMLFSQMQLEGVIPDGFTYAAVFSALVGPKFEAEGRKIHACMAGSVHESDVIVITAIISMYGKCSCINDAQLMFNKVDKSDIGVWNAMAMAYTVQGHMEEATNIFIALLRRGLIPDKVSFLTILSVCSDRADSTQGKWVHEHIIRSAVVLDRAIYNALIDMYGKCGSIEDAFSIFNAMSERDVISWSAMIGAYIQDGQASKAFRLYEEMIELGLTPDMVVFLGILCACASEISLSHGKHIHHCILNDGFEHEQNVQTALVCIYSNCGSLQDAQHMFDRAEKRGLVLWNSMIGAYTQHGLGSKALLIFYRMLEQCVIPDEISFFSILSACSHAGLLHEGHHCFILMVEEFEITPQVEHFNCMIDMLGRAGLVEEVEVLVDHMPFHPSNASWLSLLGACRVHVDMDRSKVAAWQASTLDSANPAPYVLLSNVYAATVEQELYLDAT